MEMGVIEKKIPKSLPIPFLLQSNSRFLLWLWNKFPSPSPPPLLSSTPQTTSKRTWISMVKSMEENIPPPYIASDYEGVVSRRFCLFLAYFDSHLSVVFFFMTKLFFECDLVTCLWKFIGQSVHAECYYEGVIIPTHWGLCAQSLWGVGSFLSMDWSILWCDGMISKLVSLDQLRLIIEVVSNWLLCSLWSFTTSNPCLLNHWRLHFFFNSNQKYFPSVPCGLFC